MWFKMYDLVPGQGDVARDDPPTDMDNSSDSYVSYCTLDFPMSIQCVIDTVNPAKRRGG